MLNKVLQVIGLISLFVFSLFYTDKVVTVVREQDPIMIKINEYEKSYNIDAVNAIMTNKDMIPGLNGCVVDINKSYTKMKEVGSYNKNMIEYKEIKPELSLDNIYNRYIIKGKKDTNEIAVLFKVNNDNNVLDILTVLKDKDIKASFFLDGKWVEANPDIVYKIVKGKHEIYNLGYEGEYTKDLIIWTNNLLETIAHNKVNYCLVNTDNTKVLDLCAKNKMHTIKSLIEINSHNNFNLIKDKIEKGSLITFDINSNTTNELLSMITYLSRKGYHYNSLSNHLNEKRCTQIN